MATTFTATSTDVCRPHRGPVRLRNFPEGPTQTFKRGFPVRLSATSGSENQILVVATSGASTNIIGVAAEQASGTTNTNISVYMAEPGVEFRARIKSGQTNLFSLVGSKFGGVIDTSSNIYRIDTSDTTNLAVEITDLVECTNNDINGYLAFEFTSSARGLYKG